MSTARAAQPRELPRIVDKKQIPCVMKIFSNEFLRRKLKLDLVVGSLNRHFPFVAKTHTEIDRLWWNCWVGHSLYDLPFTRKLLVHGESRPTHCCQKKQASYFQSGYTDHDGSPVRAAFVSIAQMSTLEGRLSTIGPQRISLVALHMSVSGLTRTRSPPMVKLNGGTLPGHRQTLFAKTLKNWRSLGDSNPCFRRERATSWAARRRELRPRNSLDHKTPQGSSLPGIIAAAAGFGRPV